MKPAFSFRCIRSPLLTVALTLICPVLTLAGPASGQTEFAYFPPPESQGGWRKLQDRAQIRELTGMDPVKLENLRKWLRESDNRNFAAIVIRRGYIVLEEERGNSAISHTGRVASCSKAVCATVLAIASERSQQGLTPVRMSFDDRAFNFIPPAQPLSDPRKAQITVRQLLNHTSGICPEATGAPNDGSWEYILGHTGDVRTEKLAFEPGKGCGYSTHALTHAALVCETVTGRKYDEFAIEALFRPIGIEHWWFQQYTGQQLGRRPSHGLGMPARALARIAYCLLRDGRWNEEQVVPRWFVEQTGQSTHDVRTPEMRWGLNPQTFSLGWERPALLTGEGGRSGEEIPRDARSKPGSGGQLMAFVPSLDLVIARQTGSSGNWEYEEFLRRACAAVIKAPSGGAAVARQPTEAQRKTRLTIKNGKWHLNDQVTYPGTRAEGLLMNVRMVNSTFEDLKKPEFDAESNTARFIEKIPEYVGHGVRAFTLCLQGGMPGYEGALNSAFTPDGSLRESYLARVRKVIEACDQQGAAVILGLYYQRQSGILRGDEAVRAGVVNAAQWVQRSGFQNVALEIANEYPHRGFAHELLKSPTGQAGLINLARETAPGLLVSSSGYGDGKLHDEVARASDFLLIHFNGTPVAEIPARIKALEKHGKPIVCNEDDKTGAEAARGAEASVANGASWGLMLNRLNQYQPFEFKGAQDDRVVYEKLKELTSK